LLQGASLAEALSRTAASMFAVIETTVRLGRYELALVAAREELLQPSQNFPVARL
jgi:pyridoxal/pyridoxine/pyridoxamine kinase